ncbi:MAG: hypothetical protein FJ303_00440 [Planctomycetes bacterium]|nr:hypothetical protein [Planctomycetota bacterium]
MFRFSLFAVSLLAISSPTLAQDAAKVEVVVHVPSKVDSFKDRQLEIRLYEFDPRIADKGATLLDKHLDKSFTHDAGKDRLVVVTLGAKAKVDPKMRYYITVFVLDAAGKRTHIGEKDGKAGLCLVLTDRNPSKVTMIARPVR